MQRVDISNFKNKKTALIMSGGVVKAAAWHLGVALALEELGFTLKNNNSPDSELEISTYVGSSAGSLIGLYFAQGFRPIDIIEATINKNNSKIRAINYKDMLSLKKPLASPSSFYDPLEGFPSLLKRLFKPLLNVSGIFSTQGLHDYLIENVINEKTFEELKADLFVVATQLDHSRKVIFSKYNYPNPSHDSTANYYTGIPLAESVTASMSVPPFYSPYPIKNPHTGQTDYYIDGEIRETLSTHVAFDHNCEFIISSWTHTPYHFHDEIGSLVNYGLPAICTQAIYLMIQKKIVANRARRELSSDIINTVNDYLKSNKFDEKHRKQLTSILERKLSYKPNVHMIDIYPKHDDYKLFFRNSFSLNPDKTSEMVSAGYKRTINIFKRHEWES
ncbi:patatin-like phospholipase family protein [Halobacteriovorax sp.]|uniref:patatin-like phospholipase family protein n=1 Tax=Halobacteriovorax sp. TaxID=2020862 RepID=UPI0035618C2C